ncbi:protein jag [Amycolatopsis cihanbeyliensis]|uniref:SpoIIIJ-associated protein n=1 Tax=Amycolatopsis cihanbeyliensis TaxID=1128664 RepID=A0A542DL85_AMYCI|nr:R3H domain-containing nucleic acid-binding protein [Amycolatopsis cihanbeyliensis]TQJ03861.1 spoIIIJ-associated protein [Amycolatopsis cihanbeyliensis]
MSETVDAIGTEESKAAVADVADAEDVEETEATEATEATERSTRVDEDVLVQEGDIAGDYLERLLDLLDYDGDIDLDVEAGRAIVSIDGGEDLEKLVGARGQVLESLQELTRLAVQQQLGSRSRLMLDVAGWRAGRRNELHELGRSTAESVLSSGERVRLQPMSPFERKVVHDAVAAMDGVHSESEGEEPKRRVVVFPQP